MNQFWTRWSERLLSATTVRLYLASKQANGNHSWASAWTLRQMISWASGYRARSFNLGENEGYINLLLIILIWRRLRRFRNGAGGRRSRSMSTTTMTRSTKSDSPTRLSSSCTKAYLGACIEWIVAGIDSSQWTISSLISRLPSRMSTYLMNTSRSRRSISKVEEVQSAQTKLIWCLRWQLKTKMNQKISIPIRESTLNWHSYRMVYPKIPSSILHSAKCISLIVID